METIYEKGAQIGNASGPLRGPPVGRPEPMPPSPPLQVTVDNILYNLTAALEKVSALDSHYRGARPEAASNSARGVPESYAREYGIGPALEIATKAGAERLEKLDALLYSTTGG